MADVDSKLLHELFEYRDGVLFWKSTRSTRKDIIGKKVGYLNTAGYLATEINGQHFMVHRLVYWLFNEERPILIDHIDRNKLNNKIENLRPATHVENSYNTKVRCDNRLSVKGVTFHKLTKKYGARCQVNKKAHWLGLFETVEDASKALQAFREQHHGEFANHG
jgi:hypothetical protein